MINNNLWFNSWWAYSDIWLHMLELVVKNPSDARPVETQAFRNLLRQSQLAETIRKGSNVWQNS